MREDEFRAFLTPRLKANALASYMANLRALERVLKVDLDTLTLDDEAIVTLRDSLVAHEMPLTRARDCASATRQYAIFRGVRPDIVERPRGQRRPVANATVPRPAFIAEATIADLMRLYADILSELRSRGVTRTANGPVGDYAERLFAHAFGWTLEGNSAAHHDAVDHAGLRYQIKARRVDSVSGSRQLGALRRLPDAGFDMLAAILFDRNMQVLRAALIPYRVVIDRSKRVEHTNSWRFMLSDAVWTLPTVRDATAALRAAASAI